MRTGLTVAGVISLVAGAALAQSIVGTGVPAGTGWFIPAGLSADGAVMVGNASNGHGYRWTEAGGFEDMGLPPDRDAASPLTPSLMPKPSTGPASPGMPAAGGLPAPADAEPAEDPMKALREAVKEDAAAKKP